MRHLRVVMSPIQSDGPGGRVIVSGFELDVARLGRALGRVVDPSPAEIELSGVLVDKVREDRRGPLTVLGTLSGTLAADGAGTQFVVEGAIQQPSLADVLEVDGHRRPRRRLFVQVVGGPELVLRLPDSLQVRSGLLEVFAKLTVGGSAQVKTAANAVLDVPLLPLALTHAVFQFVDSTDAPLRRATVRFKSSTDEDLEETTDDFGEVYLDASRRETYRFVEHVPAADERLAVVDVRLSDEPAVA